MRMDDMAKAALEGRDKEEPAADDDEASEHELAASNILDAIKAKDPKELAAALKEFAGLE